MGRFGTKRVLSSLLLAGMVLVPVAALVRGDETLTLEDVKRDRTSTPLALPSPAEYFRSLGKLTKPRWRRYLPDSPSLSVGKRPRAALALGAAITDAYVAVEAREPQQVRNQIQDIRAFGKTLGFDKEIHPRLARIGDLADAQQWDAVRYELEGATSEQRRILKLQRDEEAARLIALGGWVRALQVGTGVVVEGKVENQTLAIAGFNLLRVLNYEAETLTESAKGSRSVRAVQRSLRELTKSWEKVAQSEKSAERLARTQKLLDEAMKEIENR